MLDPWVLKSRRRGARFGLLLLAAVGAVGGFAIAAGAVGPASGVDWNMNGHDPANTAASRLRGRSGPRTSPGLRPDGW